MTSCLRNIQQKYCSKTTCCVIHRLRHFGAFTFGQFSTSPTNEEAYFSVVPIVPLAGHTVLRRRFEESLHRGSLPASLLVHGPRGVGKQRLALWLGQLLLCGTPEAPCGECSNCRHAMDLTHPDLVWVFPRPRKDDQADAAPDEVAANLAEAVSERREALGLYAAPPGTDGIFVSGVRSLVREAIKPPSVARRRVVVVGDVEQMARTEDAAEAANAFLKLLEEPPAHLTIILTSSEPGALLPTIRSRVVSIRAGRLSDAEVRALLSRPEVSAFLDRVDKDSLDLRVGRAGGAPGSLLSATSLAAARENAQRILAAASGSRGAQLRVSLAQGASGARGSYSDTLDELTRLLRDRVATSLDAGDGAAARRMARGIPAVERAKVRAAGNTHPGLLTAQLVRELAGMS